jgi:hypothetical protein
MVLVFFVLNRIIIIGYSDMLVTRIFKIDSCALEFPSNILINKGTGPGHQVN